MGKEQSRKYQITLNNPQKHGYSPKSILETLASMNAEYFCMGDEIGKEGTYHTHIFIYRKSPIRFDTLKRKFPEAHLEIAYGSCQENRDYVTKTGKWESTDKSETSVSGTFFEWGTMPAEAEEKAPAGIEIIASVESGMSTSEIIRQDPSLAFKSNDIGVLRETLLADKYMEMQREIEVHYLYGATGTGKTRSIYTQHKAQNICRITSYKTDGTIRFDAYHGQPVLVFEEFHSQIPIAEMLNYLDRYPIYLPARYTDRVACYTRVYITSNLPLAEQYVGYQIQAPAIWNAFLRRINKVFEFQRSGRIIEHPVTDYEK